MVSEKIDTFNESREAMPKHYSDFVVIDLDRTLIDNNVLMQLLYESLGGNDAADAQKKLQELRQKELANRGNSFDVLSALGEIWGIDSKFVNVLIERIVSHPDALGIVVEGTAEMLEELKQGGVLHGIVTYGENKNWQDMKVEILRRIIGLDSADTPHSVTSVKAKAHYIENEWWDNDIKQFLVPEEVCGIPGGVYAQTIHILDDKKANLENSGELNIQAYLVDAADSSSFQYQYNRLKMNLHT